MWWGITLVARASWPHSARSGIPPPDPRPLRSLHRGTALGLRALRGGMLHVRHEAGNSRVVLSFEGSLDGVTADALAATVSLTPPTATVVVNLCEAIFAGDGALARLAQALATTGRLVLFQGLRGRQKRVVERLKGAFHAP